MSAPSIAPGVYGIPVGTVDCRRTDIFGRGDGFVTLPVVSYALVTEDRIFLVDTGCSNDSHDDAEAAWGTVSKVVIPGTVVPDPLRAGLRTLGIAPEDVTDIVLTHLHMDHAGGLDLFPQAQVWVQAAELRWGLYPHSYYRLPFVRSEFAPFEERIRTIEGDTSISDDVRVVFTPGHTPGHQSVLLKGKDDTEEQSGRWHAIVGDALYTREMLDRGWRSGAMWNAEEWWNARCRLETLDSTFHVNLLFPHDPAQSRHATDPWRVG